MNCAVCRQAIEHEWGVAICFVESQVYTITLHQNCARQSMGRGAYAQLRLLAQLRGWRQAPIPGLLEQLDRSGA